MKNLTPAQLMRLAGYFVAVLLGAFMVIWGVVHGDAALVTAGIGLIGTGGIAGANINTGTVLLDATLEEFEEPTELRRSARVRGDHAAE